MPKKLAVTATATRLVWARKVDDLGKRIKSDIEIRSQFSDEKGQCKRLTDYFLFFDKKHAGVLDFPHFVNALAKMNFLGCQREIEAFFHFYDDDMTGFLDYAFLAKEVYGMVNDGRPVFDFVQLDIIEKVRTAIVDKGGACAIYEIGQKFRALRKGDTGTLLDSKTSRTEFANVLRQYGVSSASVTDLEMQSMCNSFDPHHLGLISTLHFLKCLTRGTMSHDRKSQVKTMFEELAGGMGYASINDICAAFSPKYHPEVVAGLLSTTAVAEQFKSSFAQGNEQEGYATLAEFLEYFKGISLSVQDDHAFDMVIRNIIAVNGGAGGIIGSDGFATGSGADTMTMSRGLSSPTMRRLLVTHSDGKQEVVDLMDEPSMGRFDIGTATERVSRQGVRDIADIRL